MSTKITQENVIIVVEINSCISENLSQAEWQVFIEDVIKRKLGTGYVNMDLTINNVNVKIKGV